LLILIAHVLARNVKIYLKNSSKYQCIYSALISFLVNPKIPVPTFAAQLGAEQAATISGIPEFHEDFWLLVFSLLFGAWLHRVSFLRCEPLLPTGLLTLECYVLTCHRYEEYYNNLKNYKKSNIGKSLKNNFGPYFFLCGEKCDLKWPNTSIINTL